MFIPSTALLIAWSLEGVYAISNNIAKLITEATYRTQNKYPKVLNRLFPDIVVMTETGVSEWEQTLAELNALDAEYQDDGWETISVQAGHTAALGPEEGDSDRAEFVYTVPDSAADRLFTAIESNEFTQFTVYRDETGSARYHIVELTEPDQRLVMMIAGAVDRTQLDGFQETVRSAGVIYTKFRRLDGQVTGVFQHDDPGIFFAE